VSNGLKEVYGFKVLYMVGVSKMENLRFAFMDVSEVFDPGP
jgi:hypothetical protein